MSHPATNRSYADTPWFCLGVAVVGTFMATLDGGIVSVALPVIARDFGAPLAQAQWVVAAYLLTISCLLPASGRLGDMTGRRAKYRLGFVLFALASALCGLAGSIGFLVAARVLQAVGAALLMANGPAIVAQSFPGAKRGRALGIVGTVVSLGSLAGPAAGGAALDWLGWQALFFVNVPIGLIGAFLSHRLLPDDSRRSPDRFDFTGSGLYALGIAALMLAVSQAGQWGLSSAPSLLCLATAGVALPLFARRQARAANPVVNLALLRVRDLTLGNLAAMLAFMGLFANTIVLPFFLVGVAGFTPGDTGLAMAAMPLVMSVVAPLAGWFSERLSRAMLTGCGMLLVSAALYGQSLLTASAGFGRVALGQAGLGLGLGLFLSPNNNAVLSSVPRAVSGVAGSLMALMRNLGMVCGVSLASALFETFRSLAVGRGATQAEAFMEGFRAALLAAAALTCLGAGLSLARGAQPTATDPD